MKVDHLNSFYLYRNFKKKFSKNFRDYFDENGKNLTLKNDTIEVNTNIYIPKDKCYYKTRPKIIFNKQGIYYF